MRFALLMYGDERAEAAMPLQDREALVADHAAVFARMTEAGVLVHGEPLGPARGATLVWLDGEPVVENEPLLEGPRQMGGLYIVDVTDRADAVRWATELPRSPGLVVEVRPIPDG